MRRPKGEKRERTTVSHHPWAYDVFVCIHDDEDEHAHDVLVRRKQ